MSDTEEQQKLIDELQAIIADFDAEGWITPEELDAWLKAQKQSNKSKAIRGEVRK